MMAISGERVPQFCVDQIRTKTYKDRKVHCTVKVIDTRLMCLISRLSNSPKFKRRLSNLWATYCSAQCIFSPWMFIRTISRAPRVSSYDHQKCAWNLPKRRVPVRKYYWVVPMFFWSPHQILITISVLRIHLYACEYQKSHRISDSRGQNVALDFLLVWMLDRRPLWQVMVTCAAHAR